MFLRGEVPVMRVAQPFHQILSSSNHPKYCQSKSVLVESAAREPREVRKIVGARRVERWGLRVIKGA